MPSPLRIAFWFAALMAMLASSLALADPPARVGRLSLNEGDVVFRINRQDGGSAATPNWPISSGAILDTGRDGRAEVQIGSSTFRLADNSTVEFTAVDDQRIALNVSRGSLALTVREPDQAEEIDLATAAGQVRLNSPGRYRVDVQDGRGDTEISSREGSVRVFRPGGELVVPAGRRAIVYAGGGWFLDNLLWDNFDAWAEARDAAGAGGMARQYVSPRMTGYEDLDTYGDWGTSVTYGTLWYPRTVPVGWAPYRYGRWAWVQPWGWTWIDEAPWGFAPFHYGRWLFDGGRWAWAPGAYTRHPVYAPALVAWVGQPGWSISFSSGPASAVGWFPLAPREVFVPAYRCSPTYVRQVNVAHVASGAHIDQALARHPGKPQTFANRLLAQAVTVAPASAVQSGRLITPATVSHGPQHRELSRAPVTAVAPGKTWLAPTASALRPQAEGGFARHQAPLARQPLEAASNPPPRTAHRHDRERGLVPLQPGQPATAPVPTQSFAAPVPASQEAGASPVPPAPTANALRPQPDGGVTRHQAPLGRQAQEATASPPPRAGHRHDRERGPAPLPPGQPATAPAPVQSFAAPLPAAQERGASPLPSPVPPGMPVPMAPPAQRAGTVEILRHRAAGPAAPVPGPAMQEVVSQPIPGGMPRVAVPRAPVPQPAPLAQPAPPQPARPMALPERIQTLAPAAAPPSVSREAPRGDPRPGRPEGRHNRPGDGPQGGQK